MSGYDDLGGPARISKIGKWGQNLAIDSVSTRGEINSQTKVNDLLTEIEYGPFGRVQKKTLPDLIQLHSRIYWSEGHEDAPQRSLFLSWNKSSGSSEGLTIYDTTGRELRH